MIGREVVPIRQPVQIVQVIGSTFGKLYMRRQGQEPVLLCNNSGFVFVPCRLDLVISKEEIDREAPALASSGRQFQSGKTFEDWSAIGYYLPQTEEQAPSLK